MGDDSQPRRSGRSQNYVVFLPKSKTNYKMQYNSYEFLTMITANNIDVGVSSRSCDTVVTFFLSNIA